MRNLMAAFRALPNSRRRSILLASLAVAYVVSYAPLSMQGSWVTAAYGDLDWGQVWRPLHCGGPATTPRGKPHSTVTPLGYLFAPLILIDRATIHRSRWIWSL